MVGISSCIIISRPRQIKGCCIPISGNNSLGFLLIFLLVLFLFLILVLFKYFYGFMSRWKFLCFCLLLMCAVLPHHVIPHLTSSECQELWCISIIFNFPFKNHFSLFLLDYKSAILTLAGWKCTFFFCLQHHPALHLLNKSSPSSPPSSWIFVSPLESKRQLQACSVLSEKSNLCLLGLSKSLCGGSLWYLNYFRNVSGPIPEMEAFTKDLQYRETCSMRGAIRRGVLHFFVIIHLYWLILGTYPPPQGLPSLLILLELDKS